MQTDPQIVFEQMDPSDALRARVREELAGLEQIFDRIISARVSMSAPPREHNKGYLYRTNIHLVLPGGREVAVSHNPSADRGEHDLYTSVQDAFDVARRQLRDEVRLMEGKVKAHVGAVEQIGQVERIFPEDGYGFIVTPSGHEVFFSRRKVKHNAFAELRTGSRVYFEEELGDKGPVATIVRLAPAPAER
jgi:cold shock CspA family protein/ribosome-associated translation inhibitor RaiA